MNIYITDVIDEWFGISATRIVKRLHGNAGAPVDVYINSPGGMLYEALTIYNTLRMHTGDITTHVVGLAASAASIIALAGDRRIMYPATFLMIHNPHSFLAGDAKAFRKEADVLDGHREEMGKLYGAVMPEHEVDAIYEMMDDETWIASAQAMEWGLATEAVGELPEAAPTASLSLHGRRCLAAFQRTPPEIEQNIVYTSEHRVALSALKRSMNQWTEAMRS